MEMNKSNEIIPSVSTSQSLQPFMRNNNEVLERERRPLSVFGYHTPASREYIAIWTKRMSIAFPSKTPEFWGLVAQRAQRDGLSEQRLNYIYDQLCYGLKVYDISDIFRIDISLKKWSDDLNMLPPYTPFACVGGRYFMTIEEAERMGVNYERWEMDMYRNMRKI